MRLPSGATNGQPFTDLPSSRGIAVPPATGAFQMRFIHENTKNFPSGETDGRTPRYIFDQSREAAGAVGFAAAGFAAGLATAGLAGAAGFAAAGFAGFATAGLAGAGFAGFAATAFAAGLGAVFCALCLAAAREKDETDAAQTAARSLIGSRAITAPPAA